MAAEQKPVTVYFDPALHRARRVKAAQTDRTLSEIVNEAVGRRRRSHRLRGEDK